jgi:hypothetical protein
LIKFFNGHHLGFYKKRLPPVKPEKLKFMQILEGAANHM